MISLYVHMPWCLKKCPYCDFNSHTLQQTLPESAYITKLCTDLETHTDYLQQRTIHSIFIGGGTPSLFSPEAYKKLFTFIAERYVIATGAEITLEANPGASDLSRFAGYREVGVNRISLGVQSWHNEKLKILGRIHDNTQAHDAVKAIKQAGFDNFNLDIMHGLPNQTLSQALDDIDQCLAYQPPHISWYQLTLEPNTYFAQFPPPLPQDEILWDIQAAGEKRLADAGYQNYEVSAYCRENHFSRHNLNYWQFGDYIGIGAGAHSKITLADGSIWRFWKVKHPKEYLTTTTFIAGKQQITREELPLEFMMNAMRIAQDVKLSTFHEKTGLTFNDIMAPLKKAQEQGFLEFTPDTIHVTPLGKRFLNDLLTLFMPH
jgi:putative oxygen-independent coproporphyrinogen III oxidase